MDRPAGSHDRRRCQMSACFGLSAVGRSGALAMMWDDIHCIWS